VIQPSVYVRKLRDSALNPTKLSLVVVCSCFLSTDQHTGLFVAWVAFIIDQQQLNMPNSTVAASAGSRLGGFCQVYLCDRVGAA
jgi:hypothetical protein